MPRVLNAALCFGFALILAGAQAQATKPGQDTNPNGFPSGEHFNLNIHGKQAGFVCPEQQYDELGNPIYGNSIFVPEDGSGIEIYMESGAGKKAQEITDFQVVDACTTAIDGDPAVLELPPNDKGYEVYARALAKPTDNPSMEIMPDLISVEDEAGNDLIYLGLVTDRGFETPYVTFTRTRGKSKAVDITGMFEWSGDVCYLDTAFCEPVEECTQQQLCCVDNGDGTYAACTVKVDDLCPDGTVELSSYCKSYTDEWVFNIGDFVTYLWDIDNNNLKLLQVRFYPVK